MGLLSGPLVQQALSGIQLLFHRGNQVTIKRVRGKHRTVVSIESEDSDFSLNSYPESFLKSRQKEGSGTVRTSLCTSTCTPM